MSRGVTGCHPLRPWAAQMHPERLFSPSALRANCVVVRDRFLSRHEEQVDLGPRRLLVERYASSSHSRDRPRKPQARRVAAAASFCLLKPSVPLWEHPTPHKFAVVGANVSGTNLEVSPQVRIRFPPAASHPQTSPAALFET